MKLVLSKKDYGGKIVLTYTDENGVAKDISGVNKIKVAIGRFKSSKDTIIKNAELETDGKDGKLYFYLDENDITEDGYYDCCIILEYDEFVERSKPFTIQFLPELD